MPPFDPEFLQHLMTMAAPFLKDGAIALGGVVVQGGAAALMTLAGFQAWRTAKDAHDAAQDARLGTIEADVSAIVDHLGVKRKPVAKPSPAVKLVTSGKAVR